MLKGYASLITILAVYLLFACTNLDKGNMEHLKANLEQLKSTYCSEPLAAVREKILRDIRVVLPDYPEHGLCGFFNDAIKPSPIIVLPAPTV